jgi:hypothetical protein
MAGLVVALVVLAVRAAVEGGAGAVVAGGAAEVRAAAVVAGEVVGEASPQAASRVARAIIMMKEGE